MNVGRQFLINRLTSSIYEYMKQKCFFSTVYFMPHSEKKVVPATRNL